VPAGLPISRPAVSQHLKFVREAGLVTESRGNAAPFRCHSWRRRRTALLLQTCGSNRCARSRGTLPPRRPGVNPSPAPAAAPGTVRPIALETEVGRGDAKPPRLLRRAERESEWPAARL